MIAVVCVRDCVCVCAYIRYAATTAIGASLQGVATAMAITDGDSDACGTELVVVSVSRYALALLPSTYAVVMGLCVCVCVRVLVPTKHYPLALKEVVHECYSCCSSLTVA